MLKPAEWSPLSAALLAQLGAGAVLSLERYTSLAGAATRRLAALSEVHVVRADGLAPDLPDGGFDRILVHAIRAKSGTRAIQ